MSVFRQQRNVVRKNSAPVSPADHRRRRHHGSRDGALQEYATADWLVHDPPPLCE